MESIIEDFEGRAEEVELYFTFISLTSRANVCIQDLYPRDNSPAPVRIESDLKKILKANLFLLLYNLVESSFKSALKKLIQDINNSNSTYSVLIPEIRKIWLKDKTKFFSIDAPRIDGQTQNKLDYYYGIIDNICDEVLSIPPDPDISGNLDGRSIKSLSAKYGALSDAIDRLEGDELLKVKSNRNALAHGNISFLDCGQDWTISELVIVKDQVISFMRAVLNELKIFIEQKQYQNTGA